MNVAKLFLGAPSGATLTHVRSAHPRITHTWQDIHDDVASLGSCLRRLGICPGDRLLILASSRVEVIECVLAAFTIGAAAMPISPTMGHAAIAAIVRRMKPRCCMFEDTPEPGILNALLESSSVMVSLKGTEASGCHAYHELIKNGDRSLALPSFADDHPALIIHSSGSSGVPKVIVMGHGAVVRFFEYHTLAWSQYADDSDSLDATSPLVVALPLNHLAGLALSLQCIMSGRHAYMMHFFLPHAYLKLIEQARCAYTLLTPSLYRSLLKEPYLREMDRSALRCCILAGEPCPPALMREIEAGFGVPVVAVYSMTECLSGMGHSRRDIFERQTTLGSCGRQLFGEISLRAEDGTVQEHFGELWVRNTTVHRCYLDQQMNDARLHGGWFKTGDLFARDDDGNFFHRGRVDDMFICNGKNIYPLEMEILLMEHPAVDAVCAAPVISHVKASPVPAVMVVASQPLNSREVQAHFRAHGPPHTIPQFVLFVDALPLLGSGKTDRRRAADLLQMAFDAARESAVV